MAVTIRKENIKTYGEAKQHLHDRDALETIREKNLEFRIEELEDNERKPHYRHTTPWGNGTYKPDSFISNLFQRGMARDWIKQYETDFFRAGITFSKTEGPYILIIRESGIHLVPFSSMKKQHDHDLTRMLDFYNQLENFEKGKTKVFYIDWGFVGEVVV